VIWHGATRRADEGSVSAYFAGDNFWMFSAFLLTISGGQSKLANSTPLPCTLWVPWDKEY